MNNPIHTEAQYRILEKHFDMKRPSKNPIPINKQNIAQSIAVTLLRHGNVLIFGTPGCGATTLLRKIEALPEYSGKILYHRAIITCFDRATLPKNSPPLILLDDAAVGAENLKPFNFKGRSVAAYFSGRKLDMCLAAWEKVIPLEMPNRFIEIRERGVFYEHYR